jgi:uncharacterized protein YndB with AHSA1/START domain
MFVAELFTDSSIDIDAPAQTVWAVLTDPAQTSQWVGFFQPSFTQLDSRWTLAAPVAWKTTDGKTSVDGKVTGVDYPRLLSFTVHDLSGKFDDVQSDEDGILYTLSESGGRTLLRITQGDFGKIGDNARKFYEATAESWDRALPKIKELAERAAN